MNFTKWINQNINKFLGTSFTERETEIMTIGATFTVIAVAYLLMYNVVFPNIQEAKNMTDLYKRLVLASNAINYLATDQRPDEYQVAFERAKEKTHCQSNESTKQLTLF